MDSNKEKNKLVDQIVRLNAKISEYKTMINQIKSSKFYSLWQRYNFFKKKLFKWN